MYGIVEIAGHQYRVGPGDVIDVDRLQASVGDKMEFDQVLFIGGATPAVGLPTVPGAKIQAEVVRNGRGRRFTVFRRHPGGFQRKRGHRRSYTSLKILDIIVKEAHDGP